MAKRKLLFANGEYYHIYNRSNAREVIFEKKYDILRFINLIDFYRFQETNMRFSYYSRLEEHAKADFLNSMYDSQRQIEIYSFAIMPNHYHLLVKQLTESGISKFVSNMQNGYAKYYNEKNDRYGSVFQSPFKAKRIENEEQLLHVSRYIHLNPLTAYLIKNEFELANSKLTSYADYISSEPRKFVSENTILSYFKNKKSFSEFTLDNLDYQRRLAKIKDLILE